MHDLATLQKCCTKIQALSVRQHRRNVFIARLKKMNELTTLHYFR